MSTTSKAPVLVAFGRNQKIGPKDGNVMKAEIEAAAEICMQDGKCRFLRYFDEHEGPPDILHRVEPSWYSDDQVCLVVPNSTSKPLTLWILIDGVPYSHREELQPGEVAWLHMKGAQRALEVLMGFAHLKAPKGEGLLGTYTYLLKA